jgi:hypothetical protein
VLTLVILGDLRRNWMPDEDLFRLGTFESRLKFPICKLLDRLESDWQDDNSLPVHLARTQIEALRTASDPEGRYRAKSALVRGLYDLGYNADEVRQVFKLIDWMMHLREDLEERFRIELTELEEERNMPYVTSIERMAEVRGQARLVLALLTKALGNLPDEQQKRVRGLRSEQLEQLALDLFEFQSPHELEVWLDTHTATQD